MERLQAAVIRAAACAATAVLAACASAPPAAPVVNALLRDNLFAAPSVAPDAAEIFAVSAPMQRYLRGDIAQQVRALGPQQGLLTALYERAQLKLDYDSSVTRTAAQAFEARAGNCLSLVLMTAAFAKELGLQVRYQTAIFEETWTRTGSTLVRAGHVNITLGPTLGDRANPLSRSMTIDFLPPEQARNLRTREVSEATVIAMYMNNRAVETLLRGRFDDAYAYVKAAMQADPAFASPYNTLGIVYARRGQFALAEAAFREVVAREPENTRAIANLAELYARTQRPDEAQALYARLAHLEPQPPFHYYDEGMVAMRNGDYKTARNLLARELARGTASPEVSYWLGVAYLRLGDSERASRYHNQALDASTSRGDRDVYVSILSQLKSRAGANASGGAQ